MTHARILLLALALAAPLGAAPGASDLDVKFDWDRWSRVKANPRWPTNVRRATRTFHEVLRPTRTFWAPKTGDRVLLRDVQWWEDRTGLRMKPEVDHVERHPPGRAMWLRFSLWKVPRTALIHRAELRMDMSLGDRKREERWPTRVHLDLTEEVPTHLRTDWTERHLRPPAVRVAQEYPEMWWDVTRFVQVAQQTGEIWRNVGLAVDNGGHLTNRQPRLRVWYYLPMEATAE